jgi:hypothetical protein
MAPMFMESTRDIANSARLNGVFAVIEHPARLPANLPAAPGVTCGRAAAGPPMS